VGSFICLCPPATSLALYFTKWPAGSTFFFMNIVEGIAPRASEGLIGVQTFVDYLAQLGVDGLIGSSAEVFHCAFDRHVSLVADQVEVILLGGVL
jgi:hypothetical protein